jgi:hypothetical protein
VVLILLWRSITQTVGVLVAIRENEERARFLAIRPTATNSLAFVLSAESSPCRHPAALSKPMIPADPISVLVPPGDLLAMVVIGGMRSFGLLRSARCSSSCSANFWVSIPRTSRSGSDYYSSAFIVFHRPA